MRRVGKRGSFGRIQDPLRDTSSSFGHPSELPVLLGESSEICSDPEGGRLHARQVSGLHSPGARSRFLQSSLPGPQGFRRMETSSGCLSPEQLCAEDRLLYGDTQYRPVCHTPRGLDDLHRYEGCLLPYPDSPGKSEIPEVCFQQPGLSIQGHVFRPDHSTSGIYEGDSSILQDSPSSRIQNATIPGRLASPGEISGGDDAGERVYPKPSRKVGFSDKLEEIFSYSPEHSRVSGNENRLHSFLGFSDPETSRQSCINSKRIQVLSRTSCETMDAVTRTHGISRSFGDKRETTFSPLSIPPQNSLESGHPSGLSPSPHSSISSTGSGLVVRQRSSISRGLLRSKEPRSISLLRRVKGRMGSYHRVSTSFRPMVSSTIHPSYQQFGTSGHFSGPSTSRGPSQEQNSGCVFRQHHCPILHQKTRGDTVSVALSAGQRDLRMDSGEKGFSSPSVHPRLQKCPCGLPQSEEPDSADRVDSTPTSLFRPLETLGKTKGGHFCHIKKPPSTSLLLSGPGPSSSRDRRNAPGMEQPRGLRLSSILYVKDCAQQTDPVEQHKDDSSRPLVAPKGMVSRPNVPSNRQTVASSSSSRPVETAVQRSGSRQPSHASANRVSTLIRVLRSQGMGEELARRISEGSKRKTTCTIYQHHWKEFFQWYKSKNYSFSNINCIQLCEFFLHLRVHRKLSLPAIKGYRSALSSVLIHKGLDISSDVKIKDLFRSFSLEIPKVSKDLSWNLDVVLKYLMSSSYEPLAEAPIKRLTEKTIFLVTLALAKRVSEIQALSRKVLFSNKNAVLSLTPLFRAKNDFRCKGLPRNFLIPSLEELVGDEQEALLCPVRALRIYLNRTNTLVKKSHKHLFASHKNPSLPMKKNGISFSIREVIKSAHEAFDLDNAKNIKVKAHEVRAVATSFNFIENLSLEKVMEAAQWRCRSVFATNYLKDVEYQFEDSFSLGPFISAGSLIHGM